MSEAITRLESLQVQDVMSKDVVQVSANQTMSEAATVFADHGVSAAPVMDEQGHCDGILSATDFLCRECREAESGEHSLTSDSHRLVSPAGDGPMYIGSLSENLVSSHMTRAVQSVAPDVSLLKAATIMNAEHVHRLPVIDNHGRAMGLISTMDIVSSLLNAIDEEATSFVQQMRSGDF